MNSTMKSVVGPITQAIRDYRDSGDPAAFEVLYKAFQGFIARIARRRLGSQAKLMDQEDLVQSVMGSLAIGLGKKVTWFVQGATDEQALRGMLGHMTFAHCMNVFRYESVLARRIIQRDADGPQLPTARSAQIVDPHENHEIVVQFNMIIQQIVDGLTKLHPTQGPEYARVFEGLLKYETIQEIARELGTSNRTVDRRLKTVRAYVAQQLEKLSEDMNMDGDPLA